VVAREEFREDLPIETKADKNDLVTRADRDAQQQVLATIGQEFPGDAVVCEEEDSSHGLGDVSFDVRESVPDHGDAWVIDPIDGTANFVRGVRCWTTAVAALVDGEPVGAATYFPATGDSYTAGPDSATRDGETLRVSDRTDPETFAVGLLGWWPMGDGDRGTALYREVVARFGDVRRFGSMQAALALVADGGLDAGVMPATPHPWDSLAGVHLIRQAGGTVTDVHGHEWHRDSEGLVVSNGRDHQEVLAAVRSAFDR
jgi:myo-inositol-1(or 4)-monophosphatase